VSLLGLLAWREWAHAGETKRWQADIERLEAGLSMKSADLMQALEDLAAAERIAGELETTSASLRDRATNLEAQRDHLRAETERQAERARLADVRVEAMQVELEEARQSALALSALPRELRSQLEQANAKISELENSLDARGIEQSDFPESLEVAGLSTDGSVFALAGALPEETTLPFPVYLCQRNSIQLEGWINRVENGVAIGHVELWREAASKLVKGEKVFILPRQRHEADH
jgi:hypothetical protein